MNKYQEALNMIDRQMHCKPQLYLSSELFKAHATLLELVYKENPMSVVDVGHDIYKCECGTYIVNKYQPYCGECGQKLDWREME
jgi:hypothetical protein